MTAPRPPIHRLERAARTRWRAAFVAYAAILTVATHWPALDIGTEAVPAADKVLHLYAFGLLTGFLWNAEWIRSILLLLVAGLAWVVADELTQSLPILDRQFSSLDVISGALGVLVACAWIAAMRPRGGPANRARLAMQRHVTAVLFGGPLRGRTLIAWLVVAAALAQVGLGLVFALPRIMVWLPSIVPALVYGALQALWIGIFVLIIDRLWRWTAAEALAARVCPACSAPEACSQFDERGWAPCRTCGAILHQGIWLPPLAPDSIQVRRFLQRPAGMGIVVLGAGAGLLFGGIQLFRAALERQDLASTALRAARELHDLPDDFILAIDLALLLFALAVMAWMYRGTVAAWHDRQHVICRRCGYDLRAAPLQRGLGACPECGTQFATFASPAAAA